jgi:hypothetical protein
MKKYIYTIILATLGFSLNSCNLDTDPSTLVDSDLVFSNAAHAEQVLNGTWRHMMDNYGGTWDTPGWATLLLTSDAMGSDIVVRAGSYGFTGQYNYNTTTNNTTNALSHMWALPYRVIDNMNHLITKIDDLPGDQALKTRVKAQAYALRGFMYLNLATFFMGNYQDNIDALAIPIYLIPSDRTTTGNPRSALRVVYKQVEDDLLEAHNLIGDWGHGMMKHKITRKIIAGMLARLYLQQENWVDAAKFAAEAGEEYTWMARLDYLAGFNDVGNPEWIWGHGQTTDQNNIHISYLDATLGPGSGYASFMADPNFRRFFDDNDVRTSLFEWNRAAYAGHMMYKKFRRKPNQTADQPLMRKAEMVLIEAEALAEQNKLTEAIDKLNELRIARGADTPDLSTLSQEDLVEEILIERRKELFGEGFSLPDIKRRRKSVERELIPTDTMIPGTTVRIIGHHTIRLPDGTPFVPNSPFYNFTFPLTETGRNPNWEWN